MRTGDTGAVPEIHQAVGGLGRQQQMVDAQWLAALKRGAILINPARGSVVSEAAIARYQNIRGQRHVVCPAGSLLVVLGGPAMLIGLGGGVTRNAGRRWDPGTGRLAR